MHAEWKLMEAAYHLNLTPSRGAVSVKICRDACVPFLSELGATISEDRYLFEFF